MTTTIETPHRVRKYGPPELGSCVFHLRCCEAKPKGTVIPTLLAGGSLLARVCQKCFAEFVSTGKWIEQAAR